MNTEEIRTNIVWDTSGVDRGLKRVESAAERMEQAEGAAVTASQAREAQAEQRRLQEEQRAAARQTQLRKVALRDLEREEKESAERRVAETKRMYASMDKAAEHRQAALVRETHARSGISLSSESAARRRITALEEEAGGRNGGLAGLLQRMDGNGARLAGDALDGITGQRGWVMRLNGLRHILPHIGLAGGALGAAALAAAQQTYEGAKGVSVVEGNRDSVRASYERASNIGRFSTAANGADALNGEIGAIQEQRKAQEEALTSMREWDEGRHQNIFMRAGFRSWDFLRAKLTGGQTVDQRIHEAEQQQRLTHQLDNKKHAERAQAYRNAADEAEEGVYGSRYRAQQKSIDREREAAISKARESHTSPEEIDNINRTYDAQRTQSEQAERLRTIGATRRDRQTYIRGRGEDVASKSAYAEFGEAATAYAAGGTKEDRAERKAAMDAAWQKYVETKRGEDEMKLGQASELKNARFRGSDEDRSIEAAREGVELAKKKMELAQEAGADAVRAATLELEKQKQIYDQVKLAQREKEIARSSDLALSAMALQATGQRAAAAYYGPDQRRRFAAGQAAERMSASESVREAQERLSAAQAKVREEEKAYGGKASPDSLAAQQKAKDQLKEAQIGAVDTDNRLYAGRMGFDRARQAQYDAARSQTRSMSLQTIGFGNVGAITESRAQSQAQMLEFERGGFHEMAEQVAEQQHQRELQAYNAKYLREDGRRRPMSEVHREERQQRARSRRIQRADARLERDGGMIHARRDVYGDLVDGIDPLTHERVTAAEMRERREHAAKQARAEREQDDKHGTSVFADIKKILDDRLPTRAG